jgi:phosphoglycolate phosphatase-like HAD superfamily hydrolase
LDELLQRYAANVATGLASCAIADGLAKLRKKAGNSRWLVASGGDQAELRDVFRMRGIAPFFDGGIFGSPDTKEQILAREIESGNISFPGLLMGDSTYDHRVACQSGLDFVFISDWSELKDWESYVKTHGLAAAPSLLALAERDQAFGTNEVSREGQ